MTTIQEQMAAFVFDTDHGALSAETLAMARLCLLDWLGSVYAGKGTRPAMAEREGASGREFLSDGAMSKQLHPAKAAADGLLATLLAEEGFTAATRIFEGEKGFCWAMAEACDLSRQTQGLGSEPPRILSTWFKAHAAWYHIHSAIDAVLEIRRKLALGPSDIESVRIALYPVALDLLEKVEPKDP